MALGRFRGFRGVRTKSKHFDGDGKDGIGEALRQSIPFADEGDRRALELIDLLRQVEGRPDAAPSADPTQSLAGG